VRILAYYPRLQYVGRISGDQNTEGEPLPLRDESIGKAKVNKRDILALTSDFFSLLGETKNNFN